MSENKPGEWISAESDPTFIYALGPLGFNEFWAQFQTSGPDGITREELAKRATLAKAAPDLLSALENLVSHLSENCEDGMTEHAEEMIAARAAIAKAKGGE